MMTACMTLTGKMGTRISADIIRMSAVDTNATSQIKFIREIGRADLREFIYRAIKDLPSSFTHELQEKILGDKYPNTIVKAKLKASPNHTNPPDIYLLIDIIRDDTNICHLTFHLIPSNCEQFVSKSPIHITNNRSKRRTRRMFINRKQLECGNKYTLTVSSIAIPPHNIGPDALELSSIVIDILNRWFDPNNRDSIYNHKHNNKRNIFIEQQLAIIEQWRHNKQISRGGRRRYTRHAK